MNSPQADPTTEQPFDLHLHSNCSDGSDAPAEVVRAAFSRGITLLALTDHDNVLGIPEALAEAERIGMRLLPSIEMDAEWPHEMHILGLDFDITEPRMKEALTVALRRRGERNAVIVDKLRQIGCDIRGSSHRRDRRRNPPQHRARAREGWVRYRHEGSVREIPAKGLSWVLHRAALHAGGDHFADPRRGRGTRLGAPDERTRRPAQDRSDAQGDGASGHGRLPSFAERWRQRGHLRASRGSWDSS